MKVYLLCLLVMLPLCRAELTEEDKDPGLTVQLVSDVQQIAPGKAFTVGLHMKYKPTWHTYWKIPGDVGIPPRLEMDVA